MSIQTDKKENMAYWDEIEGVMIDALRKIASLSVSEKKMAEKNEVEDDLISVCQEALDLIVPRLEEIGYEFPYVDENY